MRSVTMSRFVIAASFATLLAVVAVLTARLAGQTADSKLTTLLADLSRGRTLASGGTSSAVQDALQGGWLRINANDEVQVYILVSAVTDAAVAELAANGVTT